MSSHIREFRDSKFRDSRDDTVMTNPQQQYKLWLKNELEKRPRGTKGALARFLGVSADAVTRMANVESGKEVRDIKAHELLLMKQFFSEQGNEPDPIPAPNTEFAPIQGEQQILDTLRRIKGLKEKDVNFILGMIMRDIRFNEAEAEQSQEHDQPQRATLPHASKP